MCVLLLGEEGEGRRCESLVINKNLRDVFRICLRWNVDHLQLCFAFRRAKRDGDHDSTRLDWGSILYLNLRSNSCDSKELPGKISSSRNQSWRGQVLTVQHGRYVQNTEKPMEVRLSNMTAAKGSSDRRLLTLPFRSFPKKRKKYTSSSIRSTRAVLLILIQILQCTMNSCSRCCANVVGTSRNGQDDPNGGWRGSHHERWSYHPEAHVCHASCCSNGMFRVAACSFHRGSPEERPRTQSN